MDLASAVVIIMLTGDFGKSSLLLNIFVFNCTLSSVQDELTVPTPFGIRSFQPIVATLLEIMGSILLVNMSYSEHMWEFVEL